MFYPPTTPFLPLHDPPGNGPGYDVPPARAASPRRSPLRALAARMTRTRPSAPASRAHSQPAGLTPEGDQLSIPP